MKSFLWLLAIANCGCLILGQSVPSGISFQGRLTGSSSQPITPGSYQLQFRIWNSATNATSGLVWSQQQTVPVGSNGVFNVILGAPGGSPVPGDAPLANDLSLAFTDSSRFIGVTISSFNGVAASNPTEIVPRQQVLSSPFAVTAANGVLPGTVVQFAGSTPTGYLLCDGHAISSKQYPKLFAAIGTIWGSGDGGANDFNVPDFRGRFPLGPDNMGGNVAGRIADAGSGRVGGTGGSSAHYISVSELPPHSHGYWDIIYSERDGYDPGVSEVSVPNNVGSSATDNDNVGFQIPRVTDSTGGGSPFNIIPPFASINYIIKW